MPTLKVHPDDAGSRLDKFLRRLLRNMPLSHVYKLLRKRKVRVNGKRGKPEQLLQTGDQIIVHMETKQFRDDLRQKPKKAVRLDFRVVFEDEALLVVSKPPFLAVHPGAGHEGDSLIDQVHSYLEVRPDDKNPAAFRPSLAHRLDRDTSGLLLIGKTGKALRFLSRMFHEGQVVKYYLALAKGSPSSQQGVWEMQVERRDVPGALGSRSRGRKDGPGKTTFCVLDKTKLPGPGGALLEVSFLQLGLLTGRTHQIRSHLFQIGCPILGDARYGDVELNRFLQEQFRLRRQFLHAYCLELDHPITGQRLRWTDSIPEDLEPLFKVLHLKLPSCQSRDNTAKAR